MGNDGEQEKNDELQMKGERGRTPVQTIDKIMNSAERDKGHLTQSPMVRHAGHCMTDVKAGGRDRQRWTNR